MKQKQFLPSHCPGCGASHVHTGDPNKRKFTCGAIRIRATEDSPESVLKDCPVSAQGSLFPINKTADH